MPQVWLIPAVSDASFAGGELTFTTVFCGLRLPTPTSPQKFSPTHCACWLFSAQMFCEPVTTLSGDPNPATLRKKLSPQHFTPFPQPSAAQVLECEALMSSIGVRPPNCWK